MYAHGEACRPDEGRIDIGAACPVLSMVRESYGCIFEIRVSWSGPPGSCLGPGAPTRPSMTLLYAGQSPLALDQLAGQERWAGDCSACRCGVVPDLAPPLPGAWDWRLFPALISGVEICRQVVREPPVSGAEALRFALLGLLSGLRRTFRWLLFSANYFCRVNQTNRRCRLRSRSCNGHWVPRPTVRSRPVPLQDAPVPSTQRQSPVDGWPSPGSARCDGRWEHSGCPWEVPPARVLPAARWGIVAPDKRVRLPPCGRRPTGSVERGFVHPPRTRKGCSGPRPPESGWDISTEEHLNIGDQAVR